MNDNPYQSPLNAGAALPLELEGVARRSLPTMLFRGLVAGSIVGCVSGASAAGLLALAYINLVARGVPGADSPLIAIVFTILGGICGMFSGAGIGLLLGLLTGLAWITDTRKAALVGAVVAALAGALFGVPSGLLLEGSNHSTIWAVIGAALGGAAGLIGGAQLGRRVARRRFVTYQTPPNP